MVVTSLGAAQEFHTSPYCWGEVRTYASGEADPVELAVARIESDRKVEGTPSPNGAYSFDITGRTAESDPGQYPQLVIYNERPYLLEIRFPSTKSISKAEWINENLVFVRIWWGRVAGSDIIVM